jgi:pimeloyl-ACP methyl ester carboxylesterase
VLDGCFIDVRTMVARQAMSVGIPEFLEDVFWPGGLLFTHWLYDYHVVNAIDVIPAVKCPVLFIHEENDEFTTREETLRLLRASSNPSNEFWEASSANHSQGFMTHPQEYIEIVNGFLSNALEAVPAH